MKRFAMKLRDTYLIKDESTRYQLQDERKSEEQKLNRLKKLLQTKIIDEVGESRAIRAA